MEEKKKPGRPKKDITKDRRLEIRLTEEEYQHLQECVDRLHKTRSDVIVDGIGRIHAELDRS